jgi:hypothetical protein
MVAHDLTFHDLIFKHIITDFFFIKNIKKQTLVHFCASGAKLKYKYTYCTVVNFALNQDQKKNKISS